VDPRLNAPLEREYYRVFTQTTGKTTTAYLLPRPDGSPALVALCARKDMRTTLDRYGWCQMVTQPDRVNNMTVDDALAIAHRLHQDLKFVGGAGGVTPYPMPDDVAIVRASGTGRIPATRVAYCRAPTTSR
jgi:hypothetical protein